MERGNEKKESTLLACVFLDKFALFLRKISNFSIFNLSFKSFVLRFRHFLRCHLIRTHSSHTLLISCPGESRSEIKRRRFSVGSHFSSLLHPHSVGKIRRPRDKSARKNSKENGKKNKKRAFYVENGTRALR